MQLCLGQKKQWMRKAKILISWQCRKIKQLCWRHQYYSAPPYKFRVCLCKNFGGPPLSWEFNFFRTSARTQNVGSQHLGTMKFVMLQQIFLISFIIQIALKWQFNCCAVLCNYTKWKVLLIHVVMNVKILK